jgi:hypothetical protein
MQRKISLLYTVALQHCWSVLKPDTSSVTNLIQSPQVLKYTHQNQQMHICKMYLSHIIHYQHFSVVITTILSTPCNLVNYPEDGRDGDWIISVMNNTWYTHFTYVPLLVLLCELKYPLNAQIWNKYIIPCTVQHCHFGEKIYVYVK